MVIIDIKSDENVVYIPKHYATNSSLTLTLTSKLTNVEFPYSVEDLSGLSDYFVVEIDSTELPDGEYYYKMADGEKIVSTGLFRIGEYKAEKQEYNYTQEYYQYEG